MTGELVLITGASGHMGFRAVVNALELGYQVRAAVRNQAKADVILNAPSIKALAPGNKLTFAFVPDIIANGAYDEAVKDVTYILHIASPIPSPSDDYERTAIQPALKSTINILESALKAPAVKRIVMTSSGIAVVSFREFVMEESPRVFTANERIPDVYGPFGHHFQAYAAEKVRALNATDKFIETEQPHYEVSNIMPSFFIGKNELITDAADILNGTNRVAFSPVLGEKADGALPGAMSHVDDVAKVHVLALDPKVPGGQNFGLMSGGVNGNNWGDSVDIVRKHFPEAVKDGRLPANGTQPTKKFLYDTSETDRILGIKQKSYEEQVVSVTEHYLELLEKAAEKVEIKTALAS